MNSVGGHIFSGSAITSRILSTSLRKFINYLKEGPINKLLLLFTLINPYIFK